MITVTLPQLSISMEEGKILRWLAEDGAVVTAGQPVVEIETDKATVEVEAPAEGRLSIVAPEGAVVRVEATIAHILRDGDQASAPEPRMRVLDDVASAQEQATDAATTLTRGYAASPAARRIAAERGIDLARVRGTGPAGRVMVKDLAVATTASPRIGADLREAVLGNITASWQQIPQIHIGGELDGTGLAEAKTCAMLATGQKATVTDLLIVAVAQALRAVPELNGTLGSVADRVHLSVAVATPNGILAPVIRNVNDLSLPQVARERERLVTAAREGTSDHHDLAGGTFTLTNLGAYPVDFFAPIVSGPQIAMLATGRLVERPVAVDGMLTVRHRLWANVAIDHRGADGEAGGRFLAALERCLNELPSNV
jgi:pyruvate dehydrogenase E2 component (dihydrolipoamide acetyltransferase)